MRKHKLIWMLKHLKKSLRRQISLWRKDFIAWQRFWKSYKSYKQITPQDRQPLLEHVYPCLGDDAKEIPIEPIYYYQDSWAFEKIVSQRPKFHVDVGSHHKFIAFLSIVVSVTTVDIRALPLPLDTLNFRKGSILDLPFEDKSVPSVSSLCVIEHVGLGRYGDPLDAHGSEKAIRELKRIVQPGGDLYLSLPIDEENRTYFNAHRAFREDYILSLFEPFATIENRYIYGKNFVDETKNGFGIGCYHLRSPL